MSDVVKVCWSGGKDSTCAVLLHINSGHKVKIVSYIPMFNDNIPLLLKCHYNFILDTANYFKSLGAEFYFAKGITYCDYVRYRSTRGKYKGRAFGFPSFIRGQCGFKRDSKQKSINKVDVGYFDYMDIGIAYDEIDRQSQLTDFKRSILVERKFTEKKAFSYCKSNNLISPLYDLLNRDGCSLCPHASAKEREQWFIDYPEAVPILIDLQNFVKIERPDIFPLKSYKWFIDDDIDNSIVQLSLF